MSNSVSKTVDPSVQFRDSELLQELSSRPLQISQRATVLLEQGSGGLLALWHRSSLRHSLTDTIPRLINLLQHFFLLGQQELKSLYSVHIS